MPVELKIKFHDASDTLVKILNDANNQNFSFDFQKQPDSLIFDPYNKIILKQVSTIIGIRNGENILPVRYSLSQNYPNPFNSSTRVTYSIPNDGDVGLKIYDLLGREVRVLVNSRQNAGDYILMFNAGDMASGVYFYKLTAGEFSEIKRMVIIK